VEILRTHPEFEELGFRNLNQVYWQLHTPQLYEQAVRRQEAFIAHLGPLVVRTGDHTGRSPDDRFIVNDPIHGSKIWWGEVNQPFSEEQFDSVLFKLQAYFQGKNMFVQNCFAAAEPDFRTPLRIITETAWHNLFVRNMFRRAMSEAELSTFRPQFTLIHAPNFHAQPEIDSTNSSAFVLINFARGLILIGGTSYAGEIKKAFFSALNYHMPDRDILSMHCSANEGDRGDVALFFGLAGTGKTTLALDPMRTLIGDDEHGWGVHGIFNFEDGCYAKAIGVSRTEQPEIYGTTRRFGTILENVGMNMDNRRLDLLDESVTENTRACYPLRHIANATRTGTGGHAKNIFFLTADAFGVLPAIAKLSHDQAIYYFLTGYTGKIESTDLDEDDTPVAMFRACFSEPFLPLHPKVYANLLGKRIREHDTNVWLVNTGWTGGPYGVGRRMPLEFTRSVIRAVYRGDFDDMEMREDPFFGFQVPISCLDVPPNILNPREIWEDRNAYDAAAGDLASQISTHFMRFSEDISPEIHAAGPPLAETK